MTGITDVTTPAVDFSAVTESVVTGEMAASTAAGSAALTGTIPMVPTADDAAFTAALNGAGAGYLGSVSQHMAARTSYAGGQSLSALNYVLNEVLSAAGISAVA
jgi:transcription elongation factor